MPQGISNGHLILFRRRYTQTIRLLKHRILSSDIHIVLLRILLNSIYQLEKSIQIKGKNQLTGEIEISGAKNAAHCKERHRMKSLKWVCFVALL